MPSKVALVTGGNRGIGKAICRLLAEKGWNVCLGSRVLEKGEQALLDLDRPRGQIRPVLLDLTDGPGIRSLPDRLPFGQLDLLVNNAGILPDSHGAGDVDPGIVAETLNVNTLGPLRVTQALLPDLRRSRDPRVINVSSGMGAFAEMSGGYTAYRLSKTALNALTLLMARDLAPIRVFAMCPGWVRTEMGGSGATRSVDQGADTAVWLAETDMADTGGFYRDRKPIAW